MYLYKSKIRLDYEKENTSIDDQWERRTEVGSVKSPIFNANLTFRCWETDTPLPHCIFVVPERIFIVLNIIKARNAYNNHFNAGTGNSFLDFGHSFFLNSSWDIAPIFHLI